MDLYHILNDELQLTISSMGAELQSVTDISTKQEYLWNGDPAYWPRRSPILFPFVGCLKNNSYRYEENTYSMPRHGFARDMDFERVFHSEDMIQFRLVSNESTYAQYPFHFSMEVTYQLDGKKLHVEYKVENKDKKTMYFGAGGHPGINLPMEMGLSFEDYELEFSSSCEPERILFSSQCFVEGKSAFVLEEGQKMSMRHALFDEDPIVLEGTSGEVTLKSEKGERGVRISYPDMPYIGFWHMPHTESPYICIEPWSSLPSRQGIQEDLEKQENLISLQAGGIKVLSWTMEIL